MNRSAADWYSHQLEVGSMGEMPHRYVLGLYELLERLNNDYPNVLWEGCSGGGGRFDAGMLYYCPQIWCSDDTDAYERTKIQYGTSFFYPVSTVGSHVSAVPNHQT
jgi:alpha-galactosidase